MKEDGTPAFGVWLDVPIETVDELLRIKEMTTVQKLCRIAGDSFADVMRVEFKLKFRRNLTTSYNILMGALVSRPSNGKPFTPAQRIWIEGFEKGHHRVLDFIKNAE